MSINTGKTAARRACAEGAPREEPLIVEGVNSIKRHTRRTRSATSRGGIVEREAALHASNVQLICPECSKVTRIGHRVSGDGRKVRI